MKPLWGLLSIALFIGAFYLGQAMQTAPGVTEWLGQVARNCRKIPNYAYEMAKPVFNQYHQEIPVNHLDVRRAELPETGAEIKALFDRISRFIGDSTKEK